MVHFGLLNIGDVPRVVATLSSYDALARFAEVGTPPCEIAEVRLDLIGPEQDWLPLAQAIRAGGTPIILTLRAAFEGGKWNGDNAGRLRILEQGVSIASAIDVELKSGLAGEVKRLGVPVIVSFHDFSCTPPLEQLMELARQALDSGDVAKISTMVQTESDVDTLRRLLAREWNGPLCVIGMGAKGEVTRTEFPRAGSCLTYGYFESPAAPGQLPAEKLMTLLGKQNPPPN